MFKYNILTEEVKSDYAFEVFANSLPGLFQGAGTAMMLAMVDIEKLDTDKKWEFEVKAEKLDLLMYDFLGELVFLKDVESVLFKEYDIEIQHEEEYSLKCKANGTAIDYEKNEILTDVKAVTMHKFVLEQRDSQWYCHIIVDL